MTRPAMHTPRTVSRAVGYTTLPEQVAARLMEEIQRGTWGNQLPSERRLRALLQVSRRTVRKALALLTAKGAVGRSRSAGRRVVAGSADTSNLPREVVLICPDPLPQLRQFSVLWIDELRARLVRRGLPSEVVSSRMYFSNRPQAALTRLVQQFPGRLWVIAGSHPAMQRWWQDNEQLCVIVGSTDGSLLLPSVDIDHHAVCRHAVTHLWRLGHRHIVYFAENSHRVGDIESELGFTDGWRQLTGSQGPAPIVRFHPGRNEATAALDRILRMSLRPTALIIGHSSYYITIVTALAQRSLVIPRDISLVARDAEPGFDFIVPTPDCYPSCPSKMALAIQRQVLALAAGRPPALRTRLMPELQPGESVRRLTSFPA